jgi:2-amino-4-hydroxy-6-hydroxymethyldihydropteridine diphosphokinase
MRVVIGLGSNLGNRLDHLRSAARAIDAIAPIAGASAVYETAPVGGPPQGDFLNAAVLVEWSRDLHGLLGELLRIERELGRERRERFGPRTIDLDVLWAEGEMVATDRLDVPHPRLHERAFALRPMLDLVPDVIDPRTGARFELSLAESDALRPTADPLR